ncbi:hypothetical protein RVS70_05855 [Virgibacillus sp. M23]|uniref:hypothetical protein n=1 Tax=Virgibacillus sp. M23 TaxID=3079030 RepID=UPI002A9119E4|nr:hypothetical protein [Virgibacillus sp. M23]MDY7043726.1 hypothetical protein [Virgibacillus sp. M23]
MTNQKLTMPEKKITELNIEGGSLFMIHNELFLLAEIKDEQESEFAYHPFTGKLRIPSQPKYNLIKLSNGCQRFKASKSKYEISKLMKKEGFKEVLDIEFKILDI